MNPENLPGNEPWITKEGFFDSTKFPIDNVLKHALSDDDRVFRSGLRTLRLMFHQGRIEAGIGCDRASAKDFHEIRAVFTRGVA